MEDTAFDEITDIRQSGQWGKYLEFLGWKKHTIADGWQIFSRRAGPITVGKLQRPGKLTPQSVAEIDKVSSIAKLSFLKLEPWLTQNLELLKSTGYKLNSSPLCPPSTLIIKLKNTPDTLWGNLSHSAKYSINRAKREGGNVEFYSNPNASVLSQIYQAIRETAIKQGFFVPDPTDLQTKVNLWESECTVAVVKDFNGVINGVKMFLGFNGNIWFMHGGTTKDGRKTKLGYLLLWESILHLKSMGYAFLDLEGIDDKRFPAFTKTWGGFSHFKERFGGTAVEFPSPVTKYYGPMLKVLSRFYKSSMPF